MKRILPLVFVMLAAAAPARADQPLKVFVSILPQKYFVEQIGGSRVEVEVMIPPGKSHSTYAPLPRQLASLSRADVYFAIGVSIERTLLDKVRRQNPDLLIVDTRQGIRLRKMEAHHHHDDEDEDDAHGHAHPIEADGNNNGIGIGGDSVPAAADDAVDSGDHAPHGHEADHAHGADADDAHAAAALPDATDSVAATDAATSEADREGRDPHIWLDPLLVKKQAETICAALSRLDPEGATVYEANRAAFAAELDRLHREIRGILAPLKGHDLFVFHPAYGYFAERYHLHQVPVEIEGKTPSARQLVELIDRARAAEAKVIFVQRQFSREAARAVAEAIGGAVVEVDPLAEDYLANLRAIALAIRDGLAAGEPHPDHE